MPLFWADYRRHSLGDKTLRYTFYDNGEIT